ncbi:hypothetical protein [Ruegeria arenilitoris]|uniref:Uncharacterized protein n=1 Tax=Ruegeria arenilitoris TaxID=1173585 RepID=A0A238JXE2_9RHOB|nr:hypothetical protein [Ruegeria arenilitoris]SMX35328.1 hypothetical protein RUA8715_00921 [Ruegeria arenilitoris]
MTTKHRYHGGLQFNGDTNGALERFGHIVVATLEDYGHLVERKTLLSQTEATIVSSQYLVRLTLESEPRETSDRFGRLDRTVGLKTMVRPSATRPRNRLVISVSPVSGLMDDPEISELMLVVMLYRMVDICSTQRVEWLSPKTVLTIEQFMGAFDSLMPRKQRNRREAFEAVSGPFAGLEPAATDDHEAVKAPAKPPRPIQLTDEQLLSIAFRSDEADAPVSDAPAATDNDEDRPSDALRLTSWALTGAVASLSAPIALSMAAVNLIRGEDFRLNTQVLAYTVAIVSLNSSGAFADVANAIGL